MTLLERWDKYGIHVINKTHQKEIRRAIAIAQAVEKMTHTEQKKAILDYADELLEGR